MHNRNASLVAILVLVPQIVFGILHCKSPFPATFVWKHHKPIGRPENSRYSIQNPGSQYRKLKPKENSDLRYLWVPTGNLFNEMTIVTFTDTTDSPSSCMVPRIHLQERLQKTNALLVISMCILKAQTQSY